jgi:hypothetical protein
MENESSQYINHEENEKASTAKGMGKQTRTVVI